MSDDAPSDVSSDDDAPDFWDRVRVWTRQEHDGQWLSIGVFVAVALLGAAMITQAQVIPGYKLNPLFDESNIIDIAWNGDGTSALAIIDGSSGYSIVRLDGHTETTILENSANSVERIDNGWMVVGKNGYVGKCVDPCDAIASKSFTEMDGEIEHWTNNTDGQNIIDVSSADGVSGVLLISDSNGDDTVRYFNADKISTAASILDLGVRLNSITTLPDGEIIAVGSMPTKYPTWSEETNNPTSLPSMGVIFAIDIIEDMMNNDIGLIANNSNDDSTNETVSTGTTIEMILIHAGDVGKNQKYHSVMADSSGDGLAIVAGTDGAIRLSADMTATYVKGAPRSTSAVADNNGDIWFAGDLNLERPVLGLLESGSNTGQTVEVPQGADFHSELAVLAGDEVHFHGSSEGERVTLDPNIRNSMQSLSVLGDILFVVISLVILSMMAWNLYDNWHLGGW